MPSFAYVNHSLYCPVCSHELGINLTAFAWGYCPRYSPQQEYIYRIQDEIIWKPCQGTIPAWTYFANGIECNIGDPQIKDLIVRDSSLFWLDGHSCKECRQYFAGAAVKIIGNRIVAVWPYRQDELDNEIDIYLLGLGEHIQPKPEWQELTMSLADSCEA